MKAVMAFIFLWVAEPPEQPRNLKVLEAGSTSARVSWERPTNHPTMDSEDSLPINSFTIEWTPLQSKEIHYYCTINMKKLSFVKAK